MTLLAGKEKLLRQNTARVKRRSRQLQAAVQRWLLGFAVKKSREAIKELRAGRIGLRKAEPFTDAELVEILTTFGLRQMESTGSQVAVGLGSEWEVTPSMIDDIIASKTVLVQRITAETEASVRDSLRRLLLDASREIPQPSVGEMARRIRTQWHGDMSGKAVGRMRDVTEPEFGILPTAVQTTDSGLLYAFSPERAALIARTEAAQNESDGIFTGMNMAGVAEIEWISSKNPNPGRRRHDLMNGMTVKLGEKFINPTTGRDLRFPADPRAHISETANCGCTYAPVRLQEAA